MKYSIEPFIPEICTLFLICYGPSFVNSFLNKPLLVFVYYEIGPVIIPAMQ